MIRAQEGDRTQVSPRSRQGDHLKVGPPWAPQDIVVEETPGYLPIATATLGVAHPQTPFARKAGKCVSEGGLWGKGEGARCTLAPAKSGFAHVVGRHQRGGVQERLAWHALPTEH
jgi:hypothetical protein